MLLVALFCLLAAGDEREVLLQRSAVGRRRRGRRSGLLPTVRLFTNPCSVCTGKETNPGRLTTRDASDYSTVVGAHPNPSARHHYYSERSQRAVATQAESLTGGELGCMRSRERGYWAIGASVPRTNTSHTRVSLALAVADGGKRFSSNHNSARFKWKCITST